MLILFQHMAQQHTKVASPPFRTRITVKAERLYFKNLRGNVGKSRSRMSHDTYARKQLVLETAQSGLKFLYEPVLNVGGVRMRPDSYLTDYVLPYEHFGLNTPAFLRAAELKITRYHEASVPFIYTTFCGEPDIEDVIVDKLALATLDL